MTTVVQNAAATFDTWIDGLVGPLPFPELPVPVPVPAVAGPVPEPAVAPAVPQTVDPMRVVELGGTVARLTEENARLESRLARQDQMLEQQAGALARLERELARMSDATLTTGSRADGVEASLKSISSEVERLTANLRKAALSTRDSIDSLRRWIDSDVLVALRDLQRRTDEAFRTVALSARDRELGEAERMLTFARLHLVEYDVLQLKGQAVDASRQAQARERVRHYQSLTLSLRAGLDSSQEDRQPVAANGRVVS